jgi:cytochrome c
MRTRATVALRTTLIVLLISMPSVGAGAGDRRASRVLMFTATTGYRHASIEPGVTAIQALGERRGFSVDDTADPSAFTDRRLRRYDALVFLSTTGNPVSDAAPRKAIRRFVERGGGFVGIHAASDADETSRVTWYGRLVGAYFGGHPLFHARPSGDESCAVGTVVSCHRGTVVVEDPDHPVTRPIVRSLRASGAEGAARRAWPVYDEFYGFSSNPRTRVHVLASLDESYFDDPNLLGERAGAMGDDHPIAWCHQVGRGRSFYTGLGHDVTLFADDRYLDHLGGGITWATGKADGDCTVARS